MSSTVKINDIGKVLANVYATTTGDSVICSLPAPVHEFSEEEHRMLDVDDKNDAVSMMFKRNGKFRYVGFMGHWYDLIMLPGRKDYDIVFSSENLKSLDLIDEVGKSSEGQYLAHLVMS